MSVELPGTASKQPVTPHRPKTAGESRSPFFKNKTYLDSSTKRDSGLAPSVSTMGHDSLLDGASSPSPSRSKPDVPAILVSPESTPLLKDNTRPRTAPSRGSASIESVNAPQKSAAAPLAADTFEGLKTSIPTGDFDDPFSAHLSFSNRGSVLLDGKKAATLFGKTVPDAPNDSTGTLQRDISVSDRRLSQRVRMLYERGDENAIIERIPEDPAEHEDPSAASRPASNARPEHSPSLLEPTRAIHSGRMSNHKKEPWEAAGGIEDWRDINNGDVDRYGFIKPRGVSSRTSSNISNQSKGQPGSPQQGSALPAVDETSPGNRRLQKPPPDASKSQRLSLLSASPKSRHSSRPSSRAESRADTLAPSVSSAHSRRSVFSRTSTLNKGRSWADEAPDMLTSTAGFPGSSAEKRANPAKDAVERRREAKWAEMGAASQAGARRGSKVSKVFGAGDVFSFDATDKKVIERTWKGIPDRWRGSAWYSFLTASARRQSSKAHPFVPDDELIRRFGAHQQNDCGDDVQIDMDVPRTISGHVMFRARYRGGQRLMFRVLRALSLEYPDTGYVQGMAPLIATLLCYYDEERAFVVACRLWEHRGLAELFKPGFVGLMGALEVFEREWLAKLPAKKTLDDLGIPPMSYGTKWYLTLFCYSLPFTAQLRVWDVFILLGGGEGGIDGMGTRRQETTRAFTQLIQSTEDTMADPEKAGAAVKATPSSMGKHGFDVLHAVSAALIDGLQEGLVGSDFENAMKLVTGAVPVGREDVLMKVVKREWKENRKGR